MKIMEKNILKKAYRSSKKLLCPENEEKSLMIAAQEKIRLPLISSHKEDNNVVPSWAGFNILIEK